ncbi:asparagine synthase (glutamine-hydrolyzing) [Flavipsychrobacter stenotrophus]|uniref:asparagine synthase (glutamine-hydrolyzing) n=1 Tax=Flavipsychrobacter stenotrophus TaxID=2077091 RepID=A0A2S7SY57_9BACT|nr:asparagine synthase (glutamine-hydrolyzing) [Flavipsychrobacter stenotrophus]PQJ11638.1 asparagine synthase (glutamine-hydrolyzing) [Flavipsychrobacter stenotrophus]
MCGILSIVNKKVNSTSGSLIKASSIIRHRGPDDEGFLTWQPSTNPVIWSGGDTAASTQEHWKYDTLGENVSFKVGFGHRRLSILDLSPAGHQPMIYEKAGLTICFNGEVYNYLEIKAELATMGHKFHTTCDTEVILHAWEQWGVKCLDKFNGMFAFTMLDYRKNEMYAVRDRFGVKPLYYFDGANALYLASEIKQIRTSPDFKFELNEPIARKFLATGAVDQTSDTFYKNVFSLPCGHYLKMDLSKDGNAFEIKQWYKLIPKKWAGTFDEAVVEFRRLLTAAVDLRLRSDVTVGSCLSGGLDSSSIVCIAADLLKAKGDFAGQETVTATYDEAKYDEWKFAEEVIKKTNAHPHKTFPSFTQLKQEIDAFIWHQDEPTGSTSQFSQWAVFKATNEAGLKVMIDGQGADEQLAGYGGNDISFYAGLMKDGQIGAVMEEARAFKKEKGYMPKGFLIAAIQLSMGKALTALMPAKFKVTRIPDVDYIVGGESSMMYGEHAKSLHENLLRQLYSEPLPALLRYEDHNSMAWSVESRTPFLDYRFVEFTMGLPARFVYKNGVRKHILREAMTGIIPDAITNRRDKMGFVTPEETWLKSEGKEWFNAEIDKACKAFGGKILDVANTKKYVAELVDSKRKFNFMPWRVICFNRWFESIIKEQAGNGK